MWCTLGAGFGLVGIDSSIAGSDPSSWFLLDVCCVLESALSSIGLVRGLDFGCVLDSARSSVLVPDFTGCIPRSPASLAPSSPAVFGVAEAFFVRFSSSVVLPGLFGFDKTGLSVCAESAISPSADISTFLAESSLSLFLMAAAGSS